MGAALRNASRLQRRSAGSTGIPLRWDVSEHDELVIAHEGEHTKQWQRWCLPWLGETRFDGAQAVKSGMPAWIKSAVKFDRRDGWRRVCCDQEK